MPSLIHQLTFMAGSLARTPFSEQVKAASAAGFDSLTIWPNIWRHAMRKEGLSLADMRSMLSDNGLTLTDGDAYRDWVPPPKIDSISFGPMRSGVPRDEFLDVVEKLGGTTVIAVHLTDAPLRMDRDIESFAELCDDAAKHGLRVALEFVAFSNIPDVATAWKIVEGAGRKNGGLVVDLWHHMRSTGDHGALRKVPADKVFTVQLSDGPAKAPDNIVEEAMFQRRLPGNGKFDAVGFLRILADMGVSASLGPELYHSSFQTRAPVEIMKESLAATRRLFEEAGLPWKGAG
jgi:sugar phosphate isomerase/epimerase